VPGVFLHEVEQDPVQCRGRLPIPPFAGLSGVAEVVGFDDRRAARRLLGQFTKQVVERLLRRHVPPSVTPIGPGICHLAALEPPLEPAQLDEGQVFEQLQRRPAGREPAGPQLGLGQRAQLGLKPVAEEVEVPQVHLGPRPGWSGRLRKRHGHEPRVELPSAGSALGYSRDMTTLIAPLSAAFANTS
jgi:hypothetical protein